MIFFLLWKDRFSGSLPPEFLGGLALAPPRRGGFLIGVLAKNKPLRVLKRLAIFILSPFSFLFSPFILRGRNIYPLVQMGEVLLLKDFSTKENSSGGEGINFALKRPDSGGSDAISTKKPKNVAS
jgi:hypothetical protein